MKKILCTLLACLAASTMCLPALANNDQSVVISQNALFLQNLQKGREYALHGRYELAREHLLLALAASKDRRNKDMVANELNTVDLMIKTLR